MVTYQMIFMNTGTHNPSGGLSPITVRQVRTANPPAVQEHFKQIIKAREQIKAQPYRVPKHIAISAWDLVGAGYVINQAIDSYLTSNNYLQNVWIQIGVNVPRIEVVPFRFWDMDIIFKFADGSQAHFTADSLDAENNPILRFVRGKDKDGNNIRNSGHQLGSGSYSFVLGGAATGQAFWRAATRFGYNYDSYPVGVVIIQDGVFCRKNPITCA